MLVDFGFGEVGVDGKGGGDGWGKSVEDVGTGLEICAGVGEVEICGGEGFDGDAEALLEVIEVGECSAGGGCFDGEVLVGVCPSDAFVGASEATFEIDTPLGGTGVEGDSCEGDGEFDGPAVFVSGSFGDPESVPVAVGASVVFDEAIASCSCGSDLEEVAVASILEGVDHDGEAIVGDGFIAEHLFGDDGGRRGVEALDGDVEFFAGV